jgi:hypothetical protein
LGVERSSPKASRKSSLNVIPSERQRVKGALLEDLSGRRGPSTAFVRSRDSHSAQDDNLIFVDEILYYPNWREIMSFRNGDKSREHRLRKAREKKREVIRGLSAVKSDAKAPAKKAAKK